MEPVLANNGDNGGTHNEDNDHNGQINTPRVGGFRGQQEKATAGPERRGRRLGFSGDGEVLQPDEGVGLLLLTSSQHRRGPL